MTLEGYEMSRDGIETWVLPAIYEVTAIPQRFRESGDGSDSWTLIVSYRGNNSWSVSRGRSGSLFSMCMDQNGEWSFPPDSEPEFAGWQARHRFTRREALEIARKYCPHMVISGCTALDILAEELEDEQNQANLRREEPR